MWCSVSEITVASQTESERDTAPHLVMVFDFFKMKYGDGPQCSWIFSQSPLEVAIHLNVRSLVQLCGLGDLHGHVPILMMEYKRLGVITRGGAVQKAWTAHFGNSETR